LTVFKLQNFTTH